LKKRALYLFLTILGVVTLVMPQPCSGQVQLDQCGRKRLGAGEYESLTVSLQGDQTKQEVTVIFYTFKANRSVDFYVFTRQGFRDYEEMGLPHVAMDEMILKTTGLSGSTGVHDPQIPLPKTTLYAVLYNPHTVDVGVSAFHVYHHAPRPRSSNIEGIMIGLVIAGITGVVAFLVAKKKYDVNIVESEKEVTFTRNQYCKECGQEIETASRYCQGCGTAL